MRGDHDELEIFLEIRLIPFTNRSKVSFQRENTWLYKEDFSPKSWAIEAVVGADLRRRGGGFHWAASWLQSRDESTLISLQKNHDRTTIRPRSRHDRATIAPRSGHDLE